MSQSDRELTRRVSTKLRNFGTINNKRYKKIQDLVANHVNSFNHFVSDGLSQLIRNVASQGTVIDGKRIEISIINARILKPGGEFDFMEDKLYPSECRQARTNYGGKMHFELMCKVDGQLLCYIDKELPTTLPIMLHSSLCHLCGLSPRELIEAGEDAESFGGYFIVNGIERCVRMLIVPRRNYPMALKRKNWKQRGDHYTEFGVMMRCVGLSEKPSHITLHYLKNGNVSISIFYNNSLYMIPLMVIIRALDESADSQIFKIIMKGSEDNSFMANCAIIMMRKLHEDGLYSKQHVRDYLGSMFRGKGSNEWLTNEEITSRLLNESICVHLTDDSDKMKCLIFMLKKLLAFVQGQCGEDSPDSIANQEVVLPGSLLSMILQDKLKSWLIGIMKNLVQIFSKQGTEDIESAINTAISKSINPLMTINCLLATGNVSAYSSHGIQQTSGLSVLADRINYMRFISHFRCVHRGNSYIDMKTTFVRKMHPESWGFLCCVQTPDGPSCGLVNHLTTRAAIVTEFTNYKNFAPILCSYGITPVDGPIPIDNVYTVLFDGALLGYVEAHKASNFVVTLRRLKCANKIPAHTEIAFVERPESGKFGSSTEYPGIYIFTSPCRFIRPVYNVMTNSNESIGTFEQIYLHISLASQIGKSSATHRELDDSAILSLNASLTPFSEFNPSPRNIYQCHMCKQTMGLGCQNMRTRSDNKIYRLQTAQTPITRTKHYDEYMMDEYPLGTNAVVAIISYTGFDMEDAITINRASIERGFASAFIFSTKVIDLTSGKKKQPNMIFERKPGDDYLAKFVDVDGLPYVGTKLHDDSPFYCVKNTETGHYTVTKYTHSDSAVVDKVSILGHSQIVSVTLRESRPTVVGDKFASRHSQKGVVGLIMDPEDLPFSEDGLIPDILFNPHGIPSRMTIGNLLELISGKSGAVNGLFHDSSTFKYAGCEDTIDYFGKLLSDAGFHHYGWEKLYSGVTGCELEAEIFTGVVYYQRLRHMVSDKVQVRSTGIVDKLTRQPIKGRRRHGGIRFGEMERDALLAHGTAYTLQDRLFTCSDKTPMNVCNKCGSLLSTIIERGCDIDEGVVREDDCWVCKYCNTDSVSTVALPYALRYLIVELASVGVKTELMCG